MKSGHFHLYLAQNSGNDVFLVYDIGCPTVNFFMDLEYLAVVQCLSINTKRQLFDKVRGHGVNEFDWSIDFDKLHHWK